MNTFEDRKRGFEAKYLKDQEAQFKIRAKRNRCLGTWAAEIIKPDNTNEYVKEVRTAALEKPGDDDIIDKISNDFENSSIKISREEIIKKIEECEQSAINEYIASEKTI